MRVLYFGTYRANYARNVKLPESLRLAGVEVLECHEQLWHGVEDRVQTASGGWLKPSFWLRVARAYSRLLMQFARVGEFDIMFVAYPGVFDVFLARLLCWLRRKPLVWDILMSVYLVALDRELNKVSPISLRLLKSLEWVGLRLPDLLIQDTKAYVDWLCQTYSLRPGRFFLVPLGADLLHFRLLPPPPVDDVFRVIFYGTFIPNHGVLNIIEAAHLLINMPDIEFELIGAGPDLEPAKRLSGQYGLRNVKFLGWMDEKNLVETCVHADVLLGSFGTKIQSFITVHNKIYEGLAMGRPVVTGDSPAVREQFQHGEQVYLCRRGDPGALANALRELKSNPELRNKLAVQGQACFSEHYNTEKLGHPIKMRLENLIKKAG